jgi:hypothetical protein
MKKSEALSLLGGTVTSAAAAINITKSAVSKWPDDLPPRIADRVHAAISRKREAIAEGKRLLNARCPILDRAKKKLGK